MTLKEKWDDLQTVAKRRADNFIQAVYPEAPPIFWKIEGLFGKFNECTPKELYYSWPISLYHHGKKPTQKDVDRLTGDLNKPYEMDPERIYVSYSYEWSPGQSASTGRKASDIFQRKQEDGLYFDKVVAEDAYEKHIAKSKADQEFDKLYKKDKDYNYSANGYKFLGWQNSWKHVHFDEKGIVTADTNKARTFGYLKEDYPEYGTCQEQGHRTINVSHNQRGSEHSVSCPVCKIMWKYDSSD